MKRFSERPVRQQFRTVLGCLAAIVIFLASFYYAIADSITMKSNVSYAQSTAQKFNSEIGYLFKRVDAMFNSLMMDQNIELLMTSPFSERTPAYLNSLQKQFSSYSLMNQDLAEIALVTQEMAWSDYFDGETLRKFSGQLEGVYGTRCFGLYASPLIARAGNTEKRLIFGHNVYGMYESSHYGEYLGCVVISLELSRSPIAFPSSERTPASFLLMDQHGSAFPFHCSAAQGEEILNQLYRAGGAKWPEIDFWETEDYLAYVEPLSGAGLYMISAVDRHELDREVLGTTLLLIAATAVALSLIVLLMRVILFGIVRPLSGLSRYMDQVKAIPPGEAEPGLKLTGCAEIASLSESFNSLLREQGRLTRRLQEATVNLYETKLSLKQSELDFLRSQINPHFLYNTLGAIQALAANRGAADIEAAVGALSKLFRYHIKGEAMAPLAQELEITQAYLTIQKIRFPEKLNVLVSIRENTREIPVMRLLLQPLVENAVYHGLEPKVGTGTLFLGARLEGDFLLLSVYDDGVGMEPAQLEQLRAALNSGTLDRESGHVGLRNVQHRIRLHYGALYGLELESRPGTGTKVTVRLPAAAKEELA